MSFDPTPEQVAIIEAARSSTDGLLISALAGAAKTSTLVLIAQALSSTPILSLAFNKRIAEEMAKRLPGNCKSATMNSIGHRAWSKATARRLTVDKDKSYKLLKAKVETLKGRVQAEAYDEFPDILKAISRAKIMGYVPVGSGRPGLCTIDDFIDNLEEEPSDTFIRLVDDVLRDSIRQAINGLIDFDDQIYMPTIFGAAFEQYPLVLIDEAQDLSPLNHAMLERLARKRLIAVGDPYQSIYGFRGAVQSGMSRLQERFNLQELGLTVSFRCPKAVVELARKRAPHMTYPEWAVEGEVDYLSGWSLDQVPDGAAIVCRNNAPLFSLALQFLKNGRGINLVGSDLGPGLVRTLKKFGDPSISREAVHLAIDRWEADRLRKSKSPGATADKAECLRVFADIGETLSAAIAYAEGLFKAQGPVQLLSGHKAKGLEWDVVFHLDPWRVPSKYAVTEEAIEQELNLEYVITTRAKRRLVHVNMADMGN